MELKRFETRAEAAKWWNAWVQRLAAETGDQLIALDVVDWPDDIMFEAMKQDGYDPESAKQFL